MTKKLYEIIEDILAVGEEMEETGGMTPEQADRITALKVTMEDKLASIARLVREKQSNAERIKAEEERLAKRRKIEEASADSLLRYVQHCLGDGKSYKTPLFTFAHHKSDAVEILDEKAIPEAYRREIPARWEPDKVTMKKDWKAGTRHPSFTVKEKFTLNLK